MSLYFFTFPYISLSSIIFHYISLYFIIFHYISLYFIIQAQGIVIEEVGVAVCPNCDPGIYRSYIRDKIKWCKALALSHRDGHGHIKEWDEYVVLLYFTLFYNISFYFIIFSFIL